MLRLAVIGFDTEVLQAVGPRVRGAKLIAVDDAGRSLSPLESCDAVVVVRLPRDDSLSERCREIRKPLLLNCDCCPNLVRWSDWTDAAHQAGVPLSIANVDRHLPSRALIRQQLDAGKLGMPGLVRLHRWESETANVRADQTPFPAALLRDLDLTLWLKGSSPNSVFAVRHSQDLRPDQDKKFVQVHLGFPGGAMALVDYTNRLPSGSGYQSLSVIGSTGAAHADDHQNQQLIFCGGHPRSILTDEGTKATAEMLQSFVDRLPSGRAIDPSVESWRHVLQAADAVRRSLASGQAVSVEES